MRALNMLFVCCLSFASAANACSWGPVFTSKKMELLQQEGRQGKRLSESESLKLAQYHKDQNIAHTERGKILFPLCQNLTDEEKEIRKHEGNSCQHRDCDLLSSEELKKAPYKEGSLRWTTSPQERAEAKQTMADLTSKWTEKN